MNLNGVSYGKGEDRVGYYGGNEAENWKYLILNRMDFNENKLHLKVYVSRDLRDWSDFNWSILVSFKKFQNENDDIFYFVEGFKCWRILLVGPATVCFCPSPHPPPQALILYFALGYQGNDGVILLS